jgi:catechol 2,3-dioxygenase-like lactoylglutathione lyase family enzyme
MEPQGRARAGRNGRATRKEESSMTARLNHTIVAARDRDASAVFLAEILGLPPPLELGHFAVVGVGDDLSLDFVESDGEIVSQHYAFLVDEAEFDAIFERICRRGLAYWADPSRRRQGEINHWDDGRGLYFDDPNGHLLEIITRPYGSAGTRAKHPHPLVAATIEAPSGDIASARNPPARSGKPGGGRLAGAEGS